MSNKYDNHAYRKEVNSLLESMSLTDYFYSKTQEDILLGPSPLI